MSSAAVNSRYLEAHVCESYATLDGMGDKTSRTRSHNIKRPKSLSKFIYELVKNLRNKVEELGSLKENVRL